ncbi:MAG: DedA family protein [Thermomicrobiales bacterium]
MSEQLLAWLLTDGLLALAPVLAGAALGLPLPASLLLLAAGAFAGQGEFSLPPLLLISLVAVVAGDLAGYWLGRRGGVVAVERFGRRLGLTLAVVQVGERYLARWGGLAIFLTRFLLTPLGPVMNIVAGAGGYPLRRFLVFDVLGEMVWVAGYLALGYLFSASWDLLASLLGSTTEALTLLVIIALATALLVRLIRVKAERGPKV